MKPVHDSTSHPCHCLSALIFCPHRFKPGPTTGASPAHSDGRRPYQCSKQACTRSVTHICCRQSHLSYGVTLRHRLSPFCTAHHRHSSPTLVTLVPHRHPHSSHSSSSPTSSPILVRALVVINLVTNTLSTILEQPPRPALRQPSTAVVNNNNNNNRQDYAAATQASDQLDTLLAQLANQRGRFIYIC